MCQAWQWVFYSYVICSVTQDEVLVSIFQVRKLRLGDFCITQLPMSRG